MVKTTKQPKAEVVEVVETVKVLSHLIHLHPDRPIATVVAKALLQTLRMDSRLYYAVPLSRITFLDFHPPKTKMASPLNLSKKEILRLLRRENIKSPSKPLKERVAKLPMKSLLKIARAKAVKIPLCLSKEKLVDAIWEALENYDYRLKLYKAQRDLQNTKPMRTIRGIKSYCKLREDVGKSSIKELRFRLKPYTFFIKEVWCLGEQNNNLKFCLAPTISEVKMSKY